MATEEKKILRVGIVHEGHIVEERLLRTPGDVTVGLSPKCTFILPIAKPPEMYRLFVWAENRYWLRFTAGMVGKASVRGQILDLAAIRTGNLAKREGEFWLLPLGPADAGKVAFGEVRLLFQMVAPPPKPKKIILPPAAKGGPLAALDKAYTAAVIGSIIAHLGLVGGAGWWWHASGQFEEAQKRESIVYRVLKAEMVLKEKPEKVEVAKVEGEGEGIGGKEDGKEAGKESKPSKAYTKTAGGAGSGSDEDKYRRQVAKVRNNTLVGVLDSVGGGARGIIGREAADSDMAGAFNTGGSGGTLIASDSYGYRGSRGGGGGPGGSGGGNTYQRMSADDVRGSGPIRTGPVASGQRREEEVKIRIGGSLGAMSGPGKIDASTVESVFRRRKSAIQMCYERALKVNQSVEGKVSIRFTIGAAGTVTDISVVENSTGDSGIGSCIAEKVRSWPFPQPEGELVIVTRHFLLVKGS